MSPQKKLLLRRNAFFRQQLAASPLPQPEQQPAQTALKADALSSPQLRK